MNAAAIRTIRGFARAVLFLYGLDFRRAHGAAFADAAEHRWNKARRTASAPVAMLRTVAWLIGDAVRSAPRTWSLPRPAVWLRGSVRDIHFGMRLLVRQPSFTTAAMLVLTLGIGANIAMFSLVNALMLRPRVGDGGAALVSVHSRDRTRPGTYRAFSFAEYLELRAQSDVFASVSAQNFGIVGVRDGDVTRRAFTNIVTGEFFDTFGVRPLIGRVFREDEARPGADVPVVIVGEPMWQRLGGHDGVLGQTVTLNGRAFTIVGVMPRGFGGSLAIAAPEFWVPTGVYETIAFDVVTEDARASLADPQRHDLALVARLHPGATVASVAAGIDVLSQQRATANPDYRDQAIEIVPLSRVAVSTVPMSDGPLSGVAVVLLAFSSVVLLIAAFNVANMLLARGRSRRREFAIRLAIGGSRARLVRQLLTENLIVTAIGGAGGLLLSWWMLRLALQALPRSLPITLTLDPSPDGRVFAATAALILLGTVISGLGPALHLSRASVATNLKVDHGRGRRRSGWWTSRDVLITAQLALTLVMLTAAGLFMRGAIEAARADPGFTLDRGIIVNVDTSLGGYSAVRTREIQRDALARLRALPGVEHASIASLMPFAEFGQSRNVQKAGAALRRGDPGADAGLVEATTTSVGAGYFATMGIPLVRGRDFGPADEVPVEGERIAIIDEVLAGRLFGGGDPTGQLVQFGLDDGEESPTVMRVIGVAGGIRDDLFDKGPQPFIYTPLGRELRTNVYFHVKTLAATPAAEASMLPAIRQALRAVDPALPIVALETRASFRGRNLLVWTVGAGAGVAGALAAAALIVALVGVYGVKAYLVARRAREIGIRVSLGATPTQVLGLVFRDGLVVTVAGLTAGVGLSVLTGWLVRGFLFQGRAFDVTVIVVATCGLLSAASLATWLPARRALRIPPTMALRDN